jgi:isoquinoline 1-oxidoreductase subunit alpha
MAIALEVNGKPIQFDGDPDMPLMWFLREDLNLKGAKYGCGIGQCGACTVLVDGQAQRSCSLQMSGADGLKVTTIEGLGANALHAVQQAWLDEDVAQCGYCQAGQIMSAVALLSQKPDVTDADIDAFMTNICRCGTYFRLRKAIHVAARALKQGK